MDSSQEPDANCLDVILSCFRRKEKTGTNHETEPLLGNEQNGPNYVSPATNSLAAVLNTQENDNPSPALPNTNLSNRVADPTDLWPIALSRSSQETKNWIGNVSVVQSDADQAKELTDLVRSVEAEHKDTSSKVNIGEQDVIWRDYAKRTVSVLTVIGDIATRVIPPAAPFWIGLKALLDTSVRQSEDLVAIFGSADIVSRHVRLGRVYEAVYLDGSYQEIAPESFSLLREEIIRLYTACLELLAYSAKTMTQSSWAHFLVALVQFQKSNSMLAKLSKSAEGVSRAANACRDEITRSVTEHHQRLLQSLHEPLRLVSDGMETLLKYIEGSAITDAIEKISSVPVGTIHLAHQEARTQETCEWLLKDPRFMEWEDSACSSLLWLEGSTGVGKTFLTSKVVDRYWNTANNQTHDEGFAFFYCSRIDPLVKDLMADSKSIWQSYISQLANVPRHSDRIHTELHDLYCRARAQKRAFTTSECRDQMMKLVNSYPRTTLVLDGLDECDEGIRGAIMTLFSDLITKSENRVKIFISSRKESDITSFLRPQTQETISVGAANNSGDIKTHISDWLMNRGSSWDSVSQDVREIVYKTLVDKSDGMFRWLDLQLEELKSYLTDEAILDRLGKLPKGLPESYSELYERNKGVSQAIFQRVFAWVMFSKALITTEFLVEAIRYDLQQIDKIARTGATLQLSSPLEKSTLETICRHLIVRNPETDTWTMRHASVAEYFEIHHKGWVEELPARIATFMLVYMGEPESAPPKNLYSANKTHRVLAVYDIQQRVDGLEGWDIKSYIWQHWDSHLRSISVEESSSIGATIALKRFLADDIMALKKPSSGQYRKWVRWTTMQSYKTIDYSGDPEIVFQETNITPADHAIFGICALGLHRFLEGWWDQDLDIEQTNDKNMDLFTIAAANGDNELSQKLLELGASPNIRGIHSLYMAFSYGDEFAELLLKNKADPNLQYIPNNSTPICLLSDAVRHDRIDRAKLLLAYRADVNLPVDDDFGSPFALAICSGNMEFVKLFVQHGAEVNEELSYGFYGSPLGAAIFGAQHFDMRKPSTEAILDIIKYLIEEVGAKTSILRCSPPTRGAAASSSQRARTAKILSYLIKGGHIKRRVLENINVSPRFLTDIENGKALSDSYWTVSTT